MKSQRPYLFNAIYQWILDNDFTPHLLVDTASGQEEVPQHLVQDNKIVLNISPSAIANFGEDEVAIWFSARFSGKNQSISVPFSSMEALFARENGEGLVFPQETLLDATLDSSLSKKDMPDREEAEKASSLKKAELTQVETEKPRVKSSESNTAEERAKAKNKFKVIK